MHKDVISRLQCPACGGGTLQLKVLEEDVRSVKLGVLICCTCFQWYPIEEYFLDFLTGTLVYQKDRKRFYRRFGERLGLRKDRAVSSSYVSSGDPQKKQQQHFDWYAKNTIQAYTDYSNQPFWLAEDRLAFDAWRRRITKGSWLLDVGCAQGRSTFNVSDIPIHVVAFDVSKQMIREAVRRYRSKSHTARITFIVADAMKFPVAQRSFDYVLVYGVLHHLPNPQRICGEIGRVLRKGGLYMGSENNMSVFRKFFDIWQKMLPLWYEEAGAHPLVSKELLTRWFAGTDISVQMGTSVFVPPHLLNCLPSNAAHALLQITDTICTNIPFLKNNGGLLLTTGTKK